MCTPLPHLDLDPPATLPCALHAATALTSDQTGPDEGGCEHSPGSVPAALPGGREEEAGGAGHAGGGAQGGAGGQVRQGPQERQGQEQRQEKEVDCRHRRRWMNNPIRWQSGTKENAVGCLVGWLVGYYLCWSVVGWLSSSFSWVSWLFRNPHRIPHHTADEWKSPLAAAGCFPGNRSLFWEWVKLPEKLLKRIAILVTCLAPCCGEAYSAGN